MEQKNKIIEDYIINISKQVNSQYNGLIDDDKISKAIEMFKKAIVESEFNTWQTASGEIVSFRMKDAKLASSLHVKFEDKNPKVQKKDFSHAVGLAATQSPLGFYAKVDLTIFLLSPDTGRPLSDQEIYEISLHEIGHALGLQHSTSRMDIMYPLVHGQVFLSPNDLNMLKQIYLPD